VKLESEDGIPNQLQLVAPGMSPVKVVWKLILDLKFANQPWETRLHLTLMYDSFFGLQCRLYTVSYTL